MQMMAIALPAAAGFMIGGPAGAAAGASIGMQMDAAHNAGEAQKNQANFEANQMQQNANNEQAAAEEKVVQQNKETAYVMSNAQAAAAASGGSATDPSVITNMKTIAGEGRFRALTDMYEGNAQAQAMRTQADATRISGDNAARAGNMAAIGKGFQGASSLYNKYNTQDTPTASTVPSYNSNQMGPYQLPWLQNS